MSIFGRNLNPFRQAVATFARAGHPFKSAWGELKNIPGRPAIKVARRLYEESTRFFANEEFWRRTGERTLPGPESVTPTQNLLRKKYQYIFQTQIFVKGEKDPYFATTSMLSNRRITKGTASTGMLTQLESQWGQWYGKDIEHITVQLVGIKQSVWAV